MTDRKEPIDAKSESAGGAEKETSAGSQITPAEPGNTSISLHIKDEMQGPNLIDDELTQQLINRGVQDWPHMYAAKVLWILAVTIPPIFFCLFFGLSFFHVFLGLLFLGWLTGTVMAHRGGFA